MSLATVGAGVGLGRLAAQRVRAETARLQILGLSAPASGCPRFLVSGPWSPPRPTWAGSWESRP
jgi:hypothetical protein